MEFDGSAEDLARTIHAHPTMSEGLRGMPKFQETSARYSLHIHVVSELLKKFNEGCLEEARGLEQG